MNTREAGFDTTSPQSGNAAHDLAASRGKTLWIGVILAAATFAVFFGVTRCDFVNYDDNQYITDNPHVQRGLSWKSVAWAFDPTRGDYWRPLVNLSHMLDVELFGNAAWWPHLVNLVWHVANVCLLFGLLRRMTGAVWRSAIVAALFALHPLRVESVAWVTERKDVMSGFFFLLTLWAYSRYAEEKRGKGAEGKLRTKGRMRLFSLSPFLFFYFLALAFFALGLMCKPMLVTLPFVLLLLDFWPLRRFDLSTLNSQPSTLLLLLREKLPFFGLGVAFGILTYARHEGEELLVAHSHVPVSARVTDAFVVYAVYLRKTFWPLDLALPYPIQTWAWWESALAAALVLAVCAAAFRLANSRPYLLAGWFWFLGMFVPVIGLLRVGHHFVADRFTYLPSIGLLVALVWLAADLGTARRILRASLLAATALALSACGWLTVRQIGVWRDSESLFRHALQQTRDNWLAHNNLAEDLIRQGRLDEAKTHLETAIALAPGFPKALGNMGRAEFALGRTEEAIAWYSQAARLMPDRPEALNNLGLAYARLGKLDEAISHYELALRVQPDYTKAHNGLGVVLARQQKYAEAEAHFAKALERKPDYSEARINLGHALFRQGKLDAAAVHYATAFGVTIPSDDADETLGLALIRNGALDEAVAYLERALERGADTESAHYHLGNARIEQGKVDAAFAHLEQAVKINPDYAPALNDLAWLRATHRETRFRNGAEAVRLAERAVRLTPDPDAPALDTLAAAYAETGQFTEAVATARRALELAKTAAQPELAEQIHRRLLDYEAGRAHRE